MSCNNPVNTSLCVEDSGSFCQADVVASQTVLASTATNTVQGLGSSNIPYLVITNISATAGNALSALSDGLFVSSSGNTNYTFSNTGFDI